MVKMPITMDAKQVPVLKGGTAYYRNVLLDLSKRLSLMSSLLRKEVKFAFTPN